MPAQIAFGLILVAVTFAATFPVRSDADELPALDKWRFHHPLQTLHVASGKDLNSLFTARNYSLATARTDRSIPRLYLRRLVVDLRTVEPVRAREALFIRIVLPLVARANAEIRAQRALLENIIAARKQGQDISPERIAWLDRLAQLYGGKPDELTGLRNRVDEIPPSLAIAQAIDESGWGTARLALQSNGMFGQHAPAVLGRGSLHLAGTKVNVATFPSLLDGVLAYMTNINRHRAYAKLRMLRAQSRHEGRPPTGYALADGLVDYSARGKAYVETLRRLIQAHRLEQFDTAHLATDGGAILIHASR